MNSQPKPKMRRNSALEAVRSKKSVSEPIRTDGGVTENEVKLEQAMRLASLGYWEYDFDADRATGSDESWRILGLQPQSQLTLEEFRKLIHPEDLADQIEAMAKVIRGGPDPFDEVHRIMRPEGEVRWLHALDDIVRDPAGRPLRMFGVWQDITEQKKAQEAVALFRSLMDRTNDAIEVIDPDTGRFLDVNETACVARGFTREEYLSMRVADLDPYLGQPEVWAQNIEYTRRDGFRIIEGQHRRKDGSVFPVEVSATCIRLDREYLLAVVRDISERKRLEDQFLQAQKMQAIGQLAGGVAHDFNNLLTIINGYSLLIQRQLAADSPLLQMVSNISEAGERAASLTQQLLAFSRKQVLELRVVNLNTIVTDTARMLQRLIGEDIELATLLEPDLNLVKVDRVQIEQVLMNLAVNARDAMQQGGRVTIETAIAEWANTCEEDCAFLKEGPHVLLAVTDTGLGMDEETVKHIFEPFFTTKHLGGGTGLGLATVYGIVKQSNGNIRVQSELGLGTTFRIYFPVAKEMISSDDSNAIPDTTGGTETILLVEDEQPVRALARDILETHGYNVIEASGGDEALRIAEERTSPIHLLITDVVMPGLSGRHLAERLSPIRPDMKVLYMSGYTDDAIVRHGVLRAKTGFLQKPFTPTLLAEKVRSVLDEVEAPVNVH